MTEENNEGLRELRGEGRYFGILDGDQIISGSEIVCRQCRQEGHMQRDCPHTVCSYCGVLDEHASKDCKLTIFCKKCGETGHYFNHCPLRFDDNIYCTVCNSNRHVEKMCSSVWRSYALRDDNTDADLGQQLDMEKFYCYNCGSSGHLGDDCKEYRSSRVPNDDGSAFSGENLSTPLKKMYYQKLNEEYDYYDYGYRKNQSSYNDLNWRQANDQHYMQKPLPKPTSTMQSLPTLNYPQIPEHSYPVRQQGVYYNTQNQYNGQGSYINNYNNQYDNQYGSYDNYQNNNQYNNYNNFNNYQNNRNDGGRLNYNTVYRNNNESKSYQPTKSGTIDEDFKNIDY
ncbi:hypothetical protein TPHA_0P00790 [Tetrapisispora phaffii CBS 4417]|uniref:CCHC-type domain-containing protein n=1 Tax=Tetrapisispora phaffii (strain ATCC 24235 / CBS 4417 / NBRC 1672 / NRRL Y-8282 / UCD 70-5) TaxID=1071381 RepID=G8C259_TETPH|nr:hypothetical protein TPHA_0P00790 [Tetrapisispora phaffii CBS 4417]CCE66237.1 hypothetical protein TPHA_0P00790 [Tetrapisispora phaffii CBS 4417]